MNRKRLSGALASVRVGAIRLTVTGIVLSFVPILGKSQIRTVVVDSDGDVGKYSSIAVDSHGRSHISYYDATRQVLKYAMIDDRGRSIEVVDGRSGVGSYSAIAVDRTDVPHISYYDAANKHLKYAVKRGSSWTVQTVDAVSYNGLYTSITVDQLNNPYISYYGDGNSELKLAYKENGNWEIKRCCQVTLFGGLSALGRCTVIQLEHMGSNPLILFFDVASRTLKLGIFDRTLNQWAVENVRNASGVFQDLSLALDAANQPHVAFSEVSFNGSESVQYGKKTCLGAGCLTQVTPAQPTGEGPWNFEQVDAASGDSVSLALDRTQNLPCVSYYDLAHGLRLARKSGTAWSVETIDAGWEVGLYSSIALDLSNNPHISYYDQTHGVLKYASTVVPPMIDVWIKDCPGDNGSVPSTSICTEWRFSPDIWFDNNPRPGVGNTLKARVRNRGFVTAQNVTVKFYVNKPIPPVPANIDDAATQIGQCVVTVTPDHPVTASIHWTPPAWIRPGNWCIGVILSHPADRPVTPFAPPPRDNNFAIHFFPSTQL